MDKPTHYFITHDTKVDVVQRPTTQEDNHAQIIERFDFDGGNGVIYTDGSAAIFIKGQRFGFSIKAQRFAFKLEMIK